ncbi:T9SS type B sorting domain-containing protein [Mesoflavibacter zeaxanthinifaciens]|uniref:T9SS type B sorting domain-containing protein n=1 Tax=Mesoflavibacter zeaxanthinifaciens TaxID=393060 RepID=UPI003A8EA6D8
MKYLLCKYKSLFILLFIFSKSFYAQNETNNWYFGDYSGLDFNFAQVNIQYDSSMSTPAGCSSISDRDGNLMFYTNGQTVWNKNHEIMDNGEGLNAEIENNQSSIIIPDPNNENIYFILTTKIDTSSGGIFFSKVVFSNQNPLGVVTDKNVTITTSSTERITAVYSPETNSVKAVGIGKTNPSNDNYNAFFVITVGAYGAFIDSLAYLSNYIVIDQPFENTLGPIKFSPNGEYIAVGDIRTSTYVKLYSFNMDNDDINQISSINAGYIFTPVNVEGIEFSADSKILYFSGNFNGNGFLHKYFIDVNQPFNDKVLIEFSDKRSFGNLQLASNSKIYMTNYLADRQPYSLKHLSVINNPEDFDNIEYNPSQIIFEESRTTQGLPNFVTSYFRNRIIVKNDCFYTTLNFSLDAYATITNATWDFGDGTTGTGLNPSHQYQEAGTYIVKAVITVGSKVIDLYKEVIAYPVINLEDSYSMLQCDNDFDETSIFNLNEVHYGFDIDELNEEITDGYQLNFYTSIQDAENGTNEIENPEFFENTTNPQEIFVKITTDKNCENIQSFYIETQFQPLVTISPYIVCEDSDDVTNNNLGYFDFNEKMDEINTLLNVSETDQISFYDSYNNALTNNNPLESEYTSSSGAIWIIVRDENGSCGRIATMDLIVNSSINLDIQDSYLLCYLQDNPILDGNSSNNTWTWSDSSGNILSTQRLFQIQSSGDYNVTVTKTENGLTCSYSKDFTVQEPENVTFNNISIDGTTLYVSVDGNSLYEFSLDDQTYVGQGNNYVFQNITPGVIDIYVRDINDCERSINTQFSYIFFPKFFTPNNDRINDKWIVYGINDNLYKKVEITIYDRYGKRLYNYSLKTIRHGWDGKYNGTLLPNSDYWYKATLIDKNDQIIEKSGHFTLKR